MDYSAIHTVSLLAEDFARSGLQAGQTVLVHASLRKIGGWICGGPEAVVLALMQVLGEDGTLVMPTQTNTNTDPQFWNAPPVPESWWPIIRAERPPYDPATSATVQMGVLAEAFRTRPGVLRSAHPVASFAAWGRHARFVIHPHPYEDMFGEQSPLARLYALDARVFFLGTGHDTNTCLHLAEERAQYAGKMRIEEESTVLLEGRRRNVRYTILDYDSDDFHRLGADYESEGHPVRYGHVGQAVTRLFPMRALVDYGVTWIETRRGKPTSSNP
ncbi:MAG: AAC(3) family N-acetyltransferase [Anaerolineae bacterium]|nr:AAC(3) family N-acetyltransferase [Anaerolineae bacterium]MDW8173637.1 AAC(3) family N-acetyltransferase [Anaerolineae bacterium]